MTKKKTSIAKTESDPAAAMAQLIADAHGVLVWESETKLTNEDAKQAATVARVVANQMAKLADEKRKEFTAPLNDVLKRINAATKPTVERFQFLTKHLDGLLLDWAKAQAAAEAKRAERSAKALERKGQYQQADDLRVARADAAFESAIDESLSVRSTMKGEVTSLRELCGAIYRGEASAELVEPCAAKLNALARVGGAAPAGVQFVEVQSLRKSR